MKKNRQRLEIGDNLMYLLIMITMFAYFIISSIFGK